MLKKIQKHFEEHIQTMELTFAHLSQRLEECAGLLCSCLQSEGKILVMGNGGSAADSQHFAAELVGRFLKNRAALPAIALTTDTSILTAVGNDFGFEQVFTRQVEALACPGDVVLGISTSGSSENVLLALKCAKEKGCITVGLLGRDGGEIAPLVDLNLTVESNYTPYIQEAHLTMIHILCDLVESELFND